MTEVIVLIFELTIEDIPVIAIFVNNSLGPIHKSSLTNKGLLVKWSFCGYTFIILLQACLQNDTLCWDDLSFLQPYNSSWLEVLEWNWNEF